MYSIYKYPPVTGLNTVGSVDVVVEAVPVDIVHVSPVNPSTHCIQLPFVLKQLLLRHPGLHLNAQPVP